MTTFGCSSVNSPQNVPPEWTFYQTQSGGVHEAEHAPHGLIKYALIDTELAATDA